MTKENKPEDVIEKITAIVSKAQNKECNPINFLDACKYLGYKPSYLYKLTAKKLIPFYQPSGKKIFFYKHELDEWIRGKYGKRETEKRETKDEKMERWNEGKMLRQDFGKLSQLLSMTDEGKMIRQAQHNGEWNNGKME